MGTLLPIDATAIPRRLVLEPPLTDAELEEFCRVHDVVRIERTREGAIEMNPPAGSYSSSGNAELNYQLLTWWKTHRRGRVYESSAGFYLPDGSLLSPDAAYVTGERLERVSKAERRGFPHLCPNFVIELLSETDRLADAWKKMTRWLENGVELGWLLDPYRRRVYAYAPGRSTVHEGLAVCGSGPVAGFTLHLEEVWNCFEL